MSAFKVFLMVVGGWTLLAFITAAGWALLNHVSAEWQARRYAGAWDGADECPDLVEATPIHDAVALDLAEADLSDESLRRWLA